MLSNCSSKVSYLSVTRLGPECFARSIIIPSKMRDIGRHYTARCSFGLNESFSLVFLELSSGDSAQIYDGSTSATCSMTNLWFLHI